LKERLVLRNGEPGLCFHGQHLRADRGKGKTPSPSCTSTRKGRARARMEDSEGKKFARKKFGRKRKGKRRTRHKMRDLEFMLQEFTTICLGLPESGATGGMARQNASTEHIQSLGRQQSGFGRPLHCRRGVPPQRNQQQECGSGEFIYFNNVRECTVKTTRQKHCRVYNIIQYCTICQRK